MGLNSTGPFIHEFILGGDTLVHCDLWLVKPMGSEHWIQRVDCKVVYGLSAARGQCYSRVYCI